MRKNPKQESFLEKLPLSFGGNKLKGNPRAKRPLDSKKALHLVLKSSVCSGRFSLLSDRYSKRVQATLNFYAKKYEIRIYRYQNVGNHLHLLLYGARSKNYSRFVRAVTGRIAQTLLKDMGYEVLGGSPQQKGALKSRKSSSHSPVKFWDYRPFSRIVTWGKDFYAAKDYVLKNLLDALGLPRTQVQLLKLKKYLKSQKAQGPPPAFVSSQMEFVST